MIRPTRRHVLQWWPFLTLGVLVVGFLFMLLFSRKAPMIASLEPPMAPPGQQIVVTGDYFGRTEREGTLNLAGEIPPPSLIKSWSDQKIIFVVPEDASSGLVTVSNSQGTSTGVLFTNTQSIPTVLQPAGSPGTPLVMAVVPGDPTTGQSVTVTGRGFGTGDEGGFVRVATGGSGPNLEVGPADSLVWTDRSVTFRWPAGAGPASSLAVVTSRGDSRPFALAGQGPMTFDDPRTIAVEYRAVVNLPSGTSVDLWGPVPQRSAGTAWSLISADPAPAPGVRPLVFGWTAGNGGEKTAVYKVSLTSWARKWDGPPRGPSVGGDAPVGDLRPVGWWKASWPALKALTGKWGLDAPDPWLRVQRIQNGLAAGFAVNLGDVSLPGTQRTPAEALASGKLGVGEASALAAFLAAQSGLPSRLVSGLWKGPVGAPVPRIWLEVWLAGAGWVSWDVVDGNPGSLDNRHFAFESDAAVPDRWLARSKTFGPSAPGDLGGPSGEASGSGQEPVVRWEITETEK